MKISNPNGHCIEINGASNVRIENSEIGPCGQDGIYALRASHLSVVGNVFLDNGSARIAGAGSAVEFELGDDLVVRSNRMERVSTGVYAPSSTRIVIEHNTVRNIQGPLPRGQMVQFNNVQGGGNLVRCNTLENVPGQSGSVEDHISMYGSNGTPGDPIRILNNRTKGGESAEVSGCGVVIGDVTGGNHFVVDGNVIVNSGNCGIGLTAGSNVRITNNTIVSRGQAQANVGLLAWNLYGRGCSGNTLTGNRIWWDASIRFGGTDHMWDGSPDHSCQPLIGWDNNIIDSSLTEAEFDKPISACQ